MAVGVPHSFYRDNGKDFQAQRFGSNPRPRLSYYDGVRWDAHKRFPVVIEEPDRLRLFDALGIHTIDAIPYHPWSKPIESLFGAWARRYENMLPGWCGSDAKRKPSKLAKEIERGEILDWGELEVVFGRLVADWNTARPIGQRKRSPLDYYTDASYKPQRPPEAALRVLLARRKRHRIHNHGIELYGGRGGYTYLSEDLAVWVGESADVWWDPWAPETITVRIATDLGDEAFEAEYGRSAWIVVPRAPQGHYRGVGEEVTEMQRMRREQRTFIRGRKAAGDGVLGPGHLDPTGAFALIAGRQEQDAVMADLDGRAEEIEAQIELAGSKKRKTHETHETREDPDERAWREERRTRMAAELEYEEMIGGSEDADEPQ